MNNNPYFILLIEDDPDDVELFTEAFTSLDTCLSLQHAANGKVALELLAKYPSLPSLIVLDLNMPVFSGRETIQSIKANHAYSSIPLVVFTTSTQERDQLFCQGYGISMFTKPSSLTSLQKIVGKLILQSLGSKIVAG